MSGRHSKPRKLRIRRVIWAAGLVLLAVAGVLFLIRVSDGDAMVIAISLASISVGALMIWVGRHRPDDSIDRETGVALERLTDEGFVVLHDLLLDHRRLDYVVIGPPGVFVARTHPTADGIIRKQSRETRVSDVLTDLHEDVTCLATHVRLPVKPLLVTAKDLDVEVPDKGALVSVAGLEEFLRDEAPRLDELTVRDTLTQVLLAATARPSAEDEETRHGMNFA